METIATNINEFRAEQISKLDSFTADNIEKSKTL